MSLKKRIFFRPFFIRLFHWEYWSFNAIYSWIMPYWIILAARARSFFFFSAANPGITNGGFLNESKKELHGLIPVHLYPRTLHFSLPASGEMVLSQLQKNGLLYPLIGKPDYGGRGKGIRMLSSDMEVRDFVKNCFVDFHIQEYVSFPLEVGIFYYRYPDKDKGSISGIVRKEFLSVTGNGKTTARELIRADKRAVMYEPELERVHGEKLSQVLEPGERWILSPFGNHARGSKFIDDTSLADEELTNMIDRISQQIPGFYFGRFDIRYKDWEELKQGKNFSIIELNGAGAEPTHIYDPSHSLFFAWKEILRHWTILCRVSRINHKRGYPYLTVKQGLRMFRESDLNNRKINAMSA